MIHHLHTAYARIFRILLFYGIMICGRQIAFFSPAVWQIIDLMENKVGVPIKVLVKRARNQAKILTVVPEEAKPSS